MLEVRGRTSVGIRGRDLGENTGRLARPLGRRGFLLGAAGASAGLLLGPGANIAHAESRDFEWLANHVATRLVGADGQPVAWLPRWSRLRLMRGLPGGMLEVWVPRLSLVGRVPVSAIGRIGAPSPADLAQEAAESAAPNLVDSIGLPARVAGGANLRLWPAVRPDTQLRALPHNAYVRALSAVEGDDGDAWYHVNLLDPASNTAVGEGYVHNSLVRLPRRTGQPIAPDRLDQPGRHLEADLKEPSLIVAYEDGAPIWASLSLKGRSTSSTTPGEHVIQRRVASEIMNSETLIPPVPRTAPGGYYLKDVLYTQYFRWDGQSIHYNYWSSNWGYAGSNGCLGLPLAEARWAWDFAEVGTRVRIFA